MVSDQSDSKRELFSLYDKKIDDLYTFRDKYYIVHESSSSPNDRNNDLISKLNQLAAELESVDSSKFESVSTHLTLVGKAFNVLPEYNQKAVDSLTKAIKLDPKCVQAWNYLGECYWKKRDFLMCKNCFEQSLNIVKNKQSLRGMSMVMRQLVNVPISKDQLPADTTISNRQDYVRNLLEESIKYAKEAIQLDAKDGMSWYILANCYVSKFFSPFGQQNTSLIKQAIAAYNLALKDESVASLQSDLYFNKSMISMYEENWQDVLVCLCKALSLDPHWTEVRENLKGVLDYLNQLDELVKTKGKLKAKRYQNMIEQIKKADLGPYADGVFTAKSETEGAPNERVVLNEAKLTDLTKGLNANKVICGKVICGLPPKNSDNLNLICFTCCISDSEGNCAALTIYNLASGHGVIIGDSIAIPEPWLESVDFTFNVDAHLKNKMLVDDIKSLKKSGDSALNEFTFKFPSIRIENPTVLVVNGKKWTKDKVSSAFFVPKVISD